MTRRQSQILEESLLLHRGACFPTREEVAAKALKLKLDLQEFAQMVCRPKNSLQATPIVVDGVAFTYKRNIPVGTSFTEVQGHPTKYPYLWVGADGSEKTEI